MKMSKKIRVLALLLALCMCLGLLAGCKKGDAENSGNPSQNPNATNNPNSSDDPNPEETFEPLTGVAGQYTYKDSVSTLASNWNPHVYQTADDSYPLDFITSDLYSLYFNDASRPLEGREVFDGYVIVPEMAADFPVDVTTAVKASHPQLGIPDSATSGYAWQVTLRSDLKWEDGTPITAQDYVESLKRLLDPKQQNFRAADYYDGSYAIRNAINYALAGSSSWNDNGELGVQLDEMTKNANGEYMYGEKQVRIAVGYPLDEWLGGDTLKDYVEAYGDAYFGLDTWDDLVALMDSKGFVPCTDDNLALLAGVTTTNETWNETEEDLYAYLVIEDVHYDEDYSFDNVGLFASDDHTLTFVYRNALDGFYLMTYGMSTTWLVKTDIYDANLKETTTASGTVWSSTYNTSVATTSSYGPYKMVSFQTDKAMRFEKNENWYGWTDGKHTYVDPEDGQTYDMYQTTAIDTEVISESETRKQMFLSGRLMTYGLQSNDFDQYRNSEYAHVTPAETIFFLLFNGYESVINEREAAADFDQATTDLQVQMLESFRRACAVSIDRELMAATVSPQRSGGYAFLGSTYIYDPETAAYYRDTPQAKMALVDFYSINLADYNNDLDAAVAAITGYDPETAKVKFDEAYQEALELGYITDNDGDGKSDQTVTMVYAMSAEMSDFYEKTLKFLNDSLNGAAAGTGFEGKISITPSAPVGNAWSDNIRNGLMDTQLAGWSGGVLDPFGTADTWTRTESAYWGKWFDASKYNLTININGADVTMSVRQWALCLNGTMTTVDGVDYNFGYGQADVEIRLNILAAIEKFMLTSYNCVPIMQDGGMSLLSQQVYYVVEDYNPMMGRGGIRYMKYNYDDAQWADYVNGQGGQLQY